MSKAQSDFSVHLIYGGLFFILLSATIGVYWPGLEGIFLFDDIANLEKLNDIKSVGFDKIVQFSLEGEAGPLGRPLSLLTFALQANSWPVPWDFKYVNLMIHLLNGSLVFWFILSLSRLMRLTERHCLSLAFLTSAIWLLHPLQVSTVLYVIQRMTQLTTLFTLAALCVYLKGRQLLVQEKLKSGFFWVSIAVMVGGILATFSKENGVLLVLYIIVLEFTVLQYLSKPRYWRVWSSLFLYFPLVLLSLYFISHIDGIIAGYHSRDFSLGERLLTQTRILTEYIAKILLLHPYGFGLHFDDYTISRGFLTPPTTLIAIAFLLLTSILAITLRRTYPILALGVLWFLGGHVLESSFINLMLYFEHRNYLPMLGIIFAMTYGILWLFSHYLRKLSIFFAICFLCFLVLITSLETTLWGKPVEQTVFWAQEHPQSFSAQTQAITFFYKLGHYVEAEKYTQQLLKTFPKHTEPYLYLIILSCINKHMPNMQDIISRLQTSKDKGISPQLLISILKLRQAGYCQLDSETMNNIFIALRNNPNNALSQSHFYHSYALFHAIEERYGLAVKAEKQALASKNSITLGKMLIQWLILDKQFDEAMDFLRILREKINPLKIPLYDKELKWLEIEIELKRFQYNVQNE